MAAGKPVTAQHGRRLLGELLDDLLTDHNVNGRRSLEDLTRRVGLHMRPYFGYRRCEDVKTATLNAYVARRLDEGPTPAAATLNLDLARLERPFNLVVRAGTVVHAP